MSTSSAVLRPGSLEQARRLDPLVDLLRRVADTVPDEARSMLQGHGLGLGHPLHPVLTDLPIGFWTSALALDILGGRRSTRAAAVLVGLGVITAAPTAAAGLADWSEMPREKQRVGVVHAACNVAATLMYAASFADRCRGRRARAFGRGVAGATLATLGGLLGGHLVYGTEDEADDSLDRAWTDDVRLASPPAAAVASHAFG
jgi:uncharacterized membrane protein